MKKVLKIIACSVLSALMICSSAVPAFAADQEVTPDDKASTTVTATVEGEAIVWLPSSITVSGTPNENKEYTGEGLVYVEGDMAGDRIISVVPESNIALKQDGKKDINATVTQSKTDFTYRDLNDKSSASTTVTAKTLSAGEWNGFLNYVVTMSDRDLYSGTSTDLILGHLDINSGIATPYNGESVTDTTYNGIVSNELLYLPFGSAFTFDERGMDDYIGDVDLRIYQYDEDGTYIKEFTKSDLTTSTSGAGFLLNFTVTDPEGMYVKLRFIPGKNTYTQDTVKDFKNRISVYDLLAINAPIFDNQTISQCWENNAPYEAWPRGNVIYNSANNLYYFFYIEALSHTDFNGDMVYRTSSDLISWSEPVKIFDNNDEALYSQGAVYCNNGDILLSMKNSETAGKRIRYMLRSTDNGKTWQKEELLINGEVADSGKSGSRLTILSNGMIFTNVFYNSSVGIIYSKDNGKTWNRSVFETKYNSDQTSEFNFSLLNNGNILCAERTDHGIVFSISTDGGKSFTHEKLMDSTLSENAWQSYNTPAQIVYDEATDNLEVYWIDRWGNGSLDCLYTTGENISKWLINDVEFKGFAVANSYLGTPGSANGGYPQLVKDPDGTLICFYYNNSTDGKSTTSIYSVSSIKT